MQRGVGEQSSGDYVNPFFTGAGREAAWWGAAAV
jgi:hypothetical protein